MDGPQPARTRVAPSPTGDPHVGTAYQAVFNRAFARATGGQFLLRIEDTDQTRSTPDSERQILAALRWLGLTWDEGIDVSGPHAPYRQSERTAIYREHARLLVEQGSAYRCFCTAERLEALRAAQSAAKEPPRYDRACSPLAPGVAAERATREPFVIRLRVPSGGSTTVRDELRGLIEFDNAVIDDQVLMKSDGFPTYHLANVVDDHIMRITHVVRGEEWLSSTPKHVLLYRAFGWDPPQFFHTPLLRNPDRSKLSKRRNPTSLNWYREQGYLPEALVNFLATLAWSFPDGRDVFTFDEFVAAFDWSRVSLSGPIFDLARLDHVNGLWIRRESPAALLERLVAGGFTRHAGADPALLLAAVTLLHDRLVRLAEFDDLAEYFFQDPAAWPQGELVPGKATPEGVRALLEALAATLAGLPAWDVATVEATIRSAAAGAADLKTRDALMAVRVAATGRSVSTPLFETLVAISRESACRRLTAAAGSIGNAPSVS